MKGRVWIAMCMGWATCWLAGCVAAGSAGGSGASAVVPTSGGPLGATCPTADQIGCAPGSAAKVRCTGGVWVDDGKCEAGQTCVETKAADQVTATQCLIPATTNTSRAIMCAKAAGCLPVSFGTCMHPPSQSMAQTYGNLLGIFEPKDLWALSLDAKASCISAAKDCAAVRSCAKTGSLDCSAGKKGGACNGSNAEFCSGTTSLSADCSLAGLPCSVVNAGSGTEAVCGKLSPCTAPKTFTCTGDVAKACIPVDALQSVAIDINCAIAGGKCDPAAKFDDDPDVCTFPGGVVCDPSTFEESCDGQVAVECRNGKTRRLNCAGLGVTCATYKQSDGMTSASCTESPACLGGSAGSSGSGPVVFCDGAAGYRSFDCALAGMFSDGYECTFEAQTP